MSQPQRHPQSSLPFPSTSARTRSSTDASAKAKTSSTAGPVSSKPMTRNQILGKLLTKGSCITQRTGNKPMDVVVSCSTGHQVSNMGGGKSRVTEYFQAREQKLTNQASGKKGEIFKRVIVWIDGYTGALTDLEIKDLISTHGGKISHHSSASVTHICTSSSLSGSKTQRLLTKVKGSKPFVIDPVWIVRSVAAGKRLPERDFVLLGGTESQPALFPVGSSLKNTPSSSASSPCVRPAEVIVLDDD